MEPQIPNPLTVLLPLLLLGLIWGIFVMFIAKRKGVNMFFALVLAVVPVVNIFWGVYLISLSDLSVKKRLDKMEERIKEGCC